MALLKKLDKSSTTLFKDFKYAFYTLVISISICLGPSAVGQQAPSREIVPEEIIINAPESLRKLRVEINRAQENMFNVFNELNDDDKFDVHCRYEQRWQSKIREQVCSPVYINIAQEQEANILLAQMGYIGAESGLPGVTQINHYNGLFEEKMKAIFLEHPEFREAMEEFQSLAEYLENVRKERFNLDD